MNKPLSPKALERVVMARRLWKTYRQVCDKLTILTETAIDLCSWDAVEEFFRMSDLAIIAYNKGERTMLVELYNKLHSYHHRFNELKGLTA